MLSYFTQRSCSLQHQAPSPFSTGTLPSDIITQLTTLRRMPREDPPPSLPMQRPFAMGRGDRAFTRALAVPLLWEQPQQTGLCPRDPRSCGTPR